MTKYEFVAIILAIIGLVFSLVSLAWNILLHFLARPKVQLIASIIRCYPPPPGVGDDDDILALTAVNLRSRNVTVRLFHGSFGNRNIEKPDFLLYGLGKEFTNITSKLPCKLAEGEEAHFMTIIRGSVFDLSNPKQVKYFYVTDTCGRTWKSRKWPLAKKIKERIKKEKK